MNNKNQLDIDLSLIYECGEVKILKFITNDWPATLLMDVLAAVSTEISNYHSGTKHADSILEEADQVYNEIKERFPSWDESQRPLFKLGFLSRYYDDLLLKIDRLQEDYTILRDEKGLIG